jgi:hypothetical protein
VPVVLQVGDASTLAGAIWIARGELRFYFQSPMSVKAAQ